MFYIAQVIFLIFLMASLVSEVAALTFKKTLFMQVHYMKTTFPFDDSKAYKEYATKAYELLPKWFRVLDKMYSIMQCVFLLGVVFIQDFQFIVPTLIIWVCTIEDCLGSYMCNKGKITFEKFRTITVLQKYICVAALSYGIVICMMQILR